MWDIANSLCQGAYQLAEMSMRTVVDSHKKLHSKTVSHNHYSDSSLSSLLFNFRENHRTAFAVAEVSLFIFGLYKDPLKLLFNELIIPSGQYGNLLENILVISQQTGIFNNFKKKKIKQIDARPAGPILSLPPEGFALILSYLDPFEQMEFAKVSKHCNALFRSADFRSLAGTKKSWSKVQLIQQIDKRSARKANNKICSMKIDRIIISTSRVALINFINYRSACYVSDYFINLNKNFKNLPYVVLENLCDQFNQSDVLCGSYDNSYYRVRLPSEMLNVEQYIQQTLLENEYDRRFWCYIVAPAVLAFSSFYLYKKVKSICSGLEASKIHAYVLKEHLKEISVPAHRLNQYDETLRAPRNGE